jgi:CubicO group peptidase (beta-lactamase class C family)
MFAVGCIAVLTGLSQTLTQVQGPSPSATSAASDGLQPPDADRRKRILQELEAYAKTAMRDWNVPGMAIAIVEDEQVIYAQGFGVRTLGQPEAVTPRTVFQIGSTSKAFTAALVAMAVDEGKLRWQDRVIDRLPQFLMHDPWVTREFRIADLMTQRTGLSPEALTAEAFLGFDRKHMWQSLRYVEPVSSFRTEFAYQNSPFLVAAELTELVWSQSWEDQLRDRIFRPLGMKSTSADLKSYQDAADAATPHRRSGTKVVPQSADWPYRDWVYRFGPAGGINSCVLDMTSWLQLQIHGGTFGGRQLLKPASMRFMHTPVTPVPGADPRHHQYYCQGWVYRENSPYAIVWHNGGTSGCKTMVAMMPEAKVGIVILSNLGDTPMPEAVAFRFFDLYAGNPPRDWNREMLASRKGSEQAPASRPAGAVAPQSLDRYAGTYRSDAYGPAVVSASEGGLTLTVGPARVSLRLEPWDHDTFRLQWPDFEDEASFVTFQWSPDGTCRRVTVDVLNAGGIGVFEHVAAQPPAAEKSP